MSRFLLAIVAFIFVPVRCWKCDQETTNIDLSNGQKVTIPANAKETTYDRNIKCTWTFDVKPGKYVSLEIAAKFGPTDTFLVSNNLGYKHLYMNNNGDIPQMFTGTLYLPAALKSQIDLSSTNLGEGSLTLTLQMLDLPQLNVLPVVQVDSRKVYPLADFSNNQYVFYSKTEYVFRLAAEANNINFDACFIYSGQSPSTGTFLSGASVLMDGVPAKFKDYTSVICIPKTPQAFPPAHLVVTPVPANMDPKSTWAMRTGGDLTYTLGSTSDNEAYMTTYCPDNCREILQTATVGSGQDSTLKLYGGSPGLPYPNALVTIAKLEEIPVKDSVSYLPQQMSATWNTYSIKNGMVKLVFARNTESWLKATPRNGFVSSPAYAFPSDDQSFKTTFTSDGVISFTYNVDNMIDGSVNVTIYNNKDEVVNKKIEKEGLGKFTEKGTSMTIQYTPPAGKSSYGAQVLFEINTKGAKGAFVMMAMMLLCSFYL